ncbi:aminotransferase class III-fold pyridoxal phosphate-dependent enzyme [Microbacterium phyllosphaerae]|uniref:aminotransferase class III-fold pyridoxal phosphate-dependent enzyme n=1 Tax=Microbacterium phyllosphaerae TaxID=124798 RepID=UPI000EA347F5|nr:aminotransferase class III-fold pyridoxal phosphate-dependent enzyme [Microbacterium phyllosphaerae]
MTLLTTHTRPIDAELRARGAGVFPGPGGFYGHLSVGLNQLAPTYPQYYSRGEGARLWDVDGRSFVDAMCAWGPMVLGYAHPDVVAVQQKQLALGDTLNGPSPLAVEFAELLVDTVAHADWVMLSKNGNDATATAVRVARAATGKAKVLKASRAYHGANDAFTPLPVGVPAEERSNIISFEYNDLATVEAAVAEHDGNVAAIIATPYQHDGFVDQEIVDPAFARGLRAIADRIGAVLILDEVRSGFRLDMAGSWESLGVRPDLTAFSKAIANGAPLAAVTGIDALKDAAGSIYVTGSFWYSSAPIAAGIATLTALRDSDGPGLMRVAGERLREGLYAASASAGLEVVQSGPVQMPLLRFVDDPKFEAASLFCATALDAGAFFHPWHNWFLSTAHTDGEVDALIDAAAAGFDAVAQAR